MAELQILCATTDVGDLDFTTSFGPQMTKSGLFLRLFLRHVSRLCRQPMSRAAFRPVWRGGVTGKRDRYPSASNKNDEKNIKELLPIGQRNGRLVRQVSDLLGGICLSDLKSRKVKETFQSYIQPI